MSLVFQNENKVAVVVRLSECSDYKNEVVLVVLVVLLHSTVYCCLMRSLIIILNPLAVFTGVNLCTTLINHTAKG